jgi:lipoprotein-anchoring transpeptidase ErfK/SrfK
VTASRVRLLPKTSDGYWPADATITLNAKVNGLKTTAGNWVDKDFTSSFQTADKRVIDVDLSSQNLVACRNGTQANQFPIASGIPRHATETGKFYIYARIADEHMRNPNGPFAPDFYDIQHVPWTQYFNTNGSALHGAWWHNNFGHPMSHGCVNVEDPTDNVRWPNAAPHAKWLWDFDYLGDPVIVHGVTPGLAPSQQPAA